MTTFQSENLLDESYIKNVALELEDIEAKRTPLNKQFNKLSAIIKRYYSGQSKTIGNVRVTCIKKARPNMKKVLDSLNKEIGNMDKILKTYTEENEVMTLTILKNKDSDI